MKKKTRIIEKYINLLAGRKEEPRGYNYWLLYRLTELPDPSNQPGNQLISSVSLKIIHLDKVFQQLIQLNRWSGHHHPQI